MKRCCNWDRVACGLGLIMIAIAFFYCGLVLAGAMQDMEKYSGLGFSYPFAYYLAENDFWFSLWVLLSVTAEFVLYLTQRQNRYWLFVAMWVLHTGLWVHAKVLSVPAGKGYNPAGYYLHFAEVTLLPTIGYFVSCYLWAKESQRKTADK